MTALTNELLTMLLTRSESFLTGNPQAKRDVRSVLASWYMSTLPKVQSKMIMIWGQVNRALQEVVDAPHLEGAKQAR